MDNRGGLRGAKDVVSALEGPLAGVEVAMTAMTQGRHLHPHLRCVPKLIPNQA